MRRLTRALTLSPRALTLTAALAVAAATPGMAQTKFTDQQRDEIRQLVRDVLIKNPEILQEAMAELEKRQAETQKKAQAVALSESREALFNSPHGNVIGNPSGDVTLVEFFDYNCGYCKRALADLRVLAKSDAKLRIVLKDFPVLGPESVEAAKIALAVKQQVSGDKLFEYHSRLLETRGPVNGERALSLARDMGLDVARLQKDMQGPEVQKGLAENAMLGEKLALTGTPAFIVGDEVISGAVGVAPLREAIAATRKCGRAVC